MKLVNFASLDPVQQARSIRGLSNASQSDRQIWDEFNANPERLAFESQKALRNLINNLPGTDETNIVIPSGPTEKDRTIRTRLVQGFFRDAVLSSYDFKCAICSLNLPELLNASHIIPWKSDVARRADPRNGLSLCSIHDRSFDRGLLAIGIEFEVLLSPFLKLVRSKSPVHTAAFLEMEGKTILFPKQFAPDPKALTFHREHIFRYRI